MAANAAWTTMKRLLPVWILAVALAVRLLYIGEIHGLVTFRVPLVDGENYFELAGQIAAGDLLGGSQAFWQPPLYPYFLAVLLAVFGTSMVAIYTAQALLGSISCVLAFLIGRRLFGAKAGLWAAGILAFYGPLIYFDVQPLIPTLHIVLMLSGLLFLLRAGGIPSPGGRPALEGATGGLGWGLSSIATANLLLAVPLAVLWLRRRSRGLAPQALFLAGVLLPVAAVTARNAVVAHEPVLVSSNAGINFYIGNNADYRRTVGLRPGGDFELLKQEATNRGLVHASDKSRYFARRGVGFLLENPGAALRLYLEKFGELIAGREIPRNQEIYTYRAHSAVLTALLWRAGVSFPFGLVAPLALAGAWLAWTRRERRRWIDWATGSGPGLLVLLAAAYAVSILLFFPTARYRLPLVPVAALFAGNLLSAGLAVWKRPAILAALVAGLIGFNLDAARPSESWPEEGPLNRARALQKLGRWPEARAEYERAIALNPDRLDPHNALAVMAAAEGHLDETVRQYRAILERAPDFVEVHRSLGLAYLAMGRIADARRQWEEAIRIAPLAAVPLSDLCLSYLNDRDVATAEPYCTRAIEARPDLGETHFGAGLLALSKGDREGGRRELERAVELFPENHPGRRKALEYLRRLR